RGSRRASRAAAHPSVRRSYRPRPASRATACRGARRASHVRGDVCGGARRLALEDRDLVGLRIEAVADAEVGVDVAPLRRGGLELLPQLADEDVDGAVAVRHRVAPDALVDLLTLEHGAARIREQLKELELATREVERMPGHERLELIRADLELPGHDRAGLGPSVGPTAAPHYSLDARDDLLRMAGLRDPVVGAEAQAAHALGYGRALGAHDHA